MTEPIEAGIRGVMHQFREFLVALRLYGTGVEFYDQSWKPDDVVKVK